MIKLTFKHLTILLLLFGLLSYSCKRKADLTNMAPSKIADNAYLVRAEKIFSYTIDEAKNHLAQLSKQAPELLALDATMKSGYSVYKISYRSKFNGEEIIASGLLSMPNLTGNYPIASFQNGTSTCNVGAPTVIPETFLYNLINIISSQGLIIVTPDYFGFGDSKDMLHPYFHKESSNQSIRDMVLASMEFLNSKKDVGTSGNLMLFGYSQGGWASLAAAKAVESSPIEGLKLTKVACGGGAYDLIAQTQSFVNATEYVSPFYFPFYLESRRQNNLTAQTLESTFKQTYATRIPKLFNNEICGDGINKELTTTVSELITPDFKTNFMSGDSFKGLRDDLSRNSVLPWETKASLRFFHSTGDMNIIYTQSIDISEKLKTICPKDNQITTILLQNEAIGHGPAFLPWLADAINWVLK